MVQTSSKQAGTEKCTENSQTHAQVIATRSEWQINSVCKGRHSGAAVHNTLKPSEKCTGKSRCKVWLLHPTDAGAYHKYEQISTEWAMHVIKHTYLKRNRSYPAGRDRAGHCSRWQAVVREGIPGQPQRDAAPHSKCFRSGKKQGRCGCAPWPLPRPLPQLSSVSRNPATRANRLVTGLGERVLCPWMPISMRVCTREFARDKVECVRRREGMEEMEETVEREGDNRRGQMPGMICVSRWRKGRRREEQREGGVKRWVWR